MSNRQEVGQKSWGIHSPLLKPRPVDLDSFALLPHLVATLPNSVEKEEGRGKVCVSKHVHVSHSLDAISTVRVVVSYLLVVNPETQSLELPLKLISCFHILWRRPDSDSSLLALTLQVEVKLSFAQDMTGKPDILGASGNQETVCK